MGTSTRVLNLDVSLSSTCRLIAVQPPTCEHVTCFLFFCFSDLKLVKSRLIEELRAAYRFAQRRLAQQETTSLGV